MEMEGDIICENPQWGGNWKNENEKERDREALYL